MSDYESHFHPRLGQFPLGELVGRSASAFGTHPVMRMWAGDRYRTLTFTDLRDTVYAVARWLIAQGIQKGDRVAILGENRPEWGISYLAVQTAGGVSAPVDCLMPYPGIRHILDHSGARMLFVSGKLLAMIQEGLSFPQVEKIICFEPDPRADHSLDAIISSFASSSIEFPVCRLDDLAAILYTSGTTGHSKGVMLTQRNLISNVESAEMLFGFGPGDVFLSVLPIHHAFECTAGFLLPIYCGSSITYARSLKAADIVEDIKQTGATVMVGVPLLYEKMQAGILRGIKEKGKLTEGLFNLLYGTATLGEKAGMQLGTKLFAGLRKKAGLRSLKYTISGGGPLNPATADFFVRLGIKMRQGYGLTETSPITHVNPPWMARNETVGLPLPDVQCRIINPNSVGVGEICLKGPNVFIGYYQNEEATREVFDAEGWFHTGDLGVVHRDGTLQIKGRAKNVIVTIGGKNIYPEEIEHFLNQSRYIAESLVLPAVRASGYGEEAVALIYPDYEQLDLYFAEAKITPADQGVHKLIASEIAIAQMHLSEYKHIKRFRIVEEEFQKTSTRKIKRFLYSGEMVKV